ncbi:MAG: hypothetical protein ACRDTP_07870, partial [Mycobacteriales bacterium]
HAQAMMDLSVRLGRVMMTSHRSVAAVRDAVVRAAVKLPPLRRYLAEARFKPPAVYRSGFVAEAGWGGGAGALVGRRAGALVGRILHQPRVLTAGGRVVLLDEVLGPGFALVGAGCPEWAWHDARGSELSTLDCRPVQAVLDDLAPEDSKGRTGIADIDGHLHELLAPHRGRLLLVRPDRYVAAAWGPHELEGVLAVLRPFLAAGSVLDSGATGRLPYGEPLSADDKMSPVFEPSPLGGHA